MQPDSITDPVDAAALAVYYQAAVAGQCGASVGQQAAAVSGVAPAARQEGKRGGDSVGASTWHQQQQQQQPFVLLSCNLFRATNHLIVQKKLQHKQLTNKCRASGKVGLLQQPG